MTELSIYHDPLKLSAGEVREIDLDSLDRVAGGVGALAAVGIGLMGVAVGAAVVYGG